MYYTLPLNLSQFETKPNAMNYQIFCTTGLNARQSRVYFISTIDSHNSRNKPPAACHTRRTRRPAACYARAKQTADRLLRPGGTDGWSAPYHFSGHNSQTIKASYTKLSVFFHSPIPLGLRYFRAKSDVWGVHRRLRETCRSMPVAGRLYHSDVTGGRVCFDCIGEGG